ncbi:MAG: CvpA family protein [Oscillospiraceae bacterium]|nr:CvpA family protein [Oscillospiraceae bacterium]
MGIEFFWFYDLVIVAILLGITFRCYKRGFVASLLGMLAGVIALVVGVLLSNLLATAIYDGFIKGWAEEKIEESLTAIVGDSSLIRLPDLDCTQIVLKGERIGEIEFTPDSVGKIDIDLSNVDLSKTGIEKLDLEFFGLDPDELHSLKVGRTVITVAELERNSLETLVMASILAESLAANGENRLISSLTAPLGIFGGSNYSMTEIIASIIEFGGAGTGISAAITANLVAPIVFVPLRSTLFFIIFVLLCVSLSIVARKLTFINRIPLVGNVNSFLGIIAGLIKSAVIIVIVCISVKILITITGNDVIFLNTMTINESYIFKHVYNLLPGVSAI